MIERLSTYLEQRYRIPKEKVMRILQRSVIAGAAVFFVLVSTLLVAFDSIFTNENIIAPVEDENASAQTAPRDYSAPFPNGGSYISAILTEERRQEARDSVQPVYFPPDPDVPRRQIQILQQSFDYIDDVRAGRYDTHEQQLSDLAAMITLSLSEENANSLLQLDEENWTAIQTEADAVLTRVSRDDIRTSQVNGIINNLNIQVGSRFDARLANLIVDLID
jgi:membrane-associated HD superfamily phosphohydrolase